MKDPFQTDGSLNLDVDTSYEEAELWQGALKNQEGSESLAREKPAQASRVRFFYVAIAAILLLLVGRLLVLQIFNAQQNKALAEGNRIRETDIRAPRGVIYDAKHNLLARNVPNFEVTIVPSELPHTADDREAIYAKLAEPLKLSSGDIKQRAEAKGLHYGKEILIADKLDRDSSVLLRMHGGDLPGVRVADNPQRNYPNPDLFAHVLGYTGRVSEEDLKSNPDFQASDYVGKTGLEQTYERILRGKPGKARVEVNAQGQAIKELQSEDPQNGRSLNLAIDTDLQNVMTKAVDNGIKSSRHKATGGSAIALNPKNGEILGLVSLPSFNNNQFVDGIKDADYKSLAEDERKPLFNRPLSGEYPPGSTFKLVTATGALAEGIITPDKYLASPPELDIQGYKFVDWDPKGHGSVNVQNALAVSSDVFFYKVSGGYSDQRGLGEVKLGDYMKQFGIGKPTGIDLPDEHSGLVPTQKYKEDTFHEPWYIGNTYQMGIGQGFVLATPLQVATYTATIANGGVAYKPHLVHATVGADNPNDIQIMPSEPLVNLKVGRDVIKVVQDGMRQAVESGTAVELASLPIDVCGKTGTAEFAHETNAHAWFTAYAPCEDPQIVLTVMIEGGGEGSDVAVPAAKTIFETFFKVPPKTPASPAPKATP